MLADPRGFVAGIRRNDLHLRIMLSQSLEYRVERDAVVDITGRDLRFQHVAALIADGMRFIRKALFVFSLMKNAAFRIRRRFDHRLFLRRFIIVIILFQRLLSVC